MKKANYIEKRNYKPIKLADSLQGINKEFLNKFGKIDYTIYSKWAEIVGIFFFQYSKPKKITILLKSSVESNIEYYERTLHIDVTPAAAVEFQHFQNIIIEKINSFLGYQAIHRIQIHQSFVSKNIDTSPKTINKSDRNLFNQKKTEIKDTIKKINDKELEKSLLNLGLSITNNEEN